ncbi:phosphotransferase family protein [Haloarchaeobius litoreus]|uniref:Phosphotransferase family protein n=1 Tax=Haloarchaeobius litoreus TaxID=755306 RepID=A0ABD6DEP0_9EURY|nr:phosphotransferase [Haloarchaeobius litoreus]
MNDDRTTDGDTIQRMVQQIEPNWRVVEATPATAGHQIVYLLTVETGSGPRDCVLKATPDGKPATCDVEARMLAIVGEHTTVPVPEVFGVVDEHDELPAPFFLSSREPGADFDRTWLGDLTADRIDALARSSGRHLASLHAMGAVDDYGYVGVEYEEPLAGGRPSADTDQLVVADPVEDWSDCLRSSVEGVVAGLDETRFADLQETVAPAVEAAIERVDDPDDPAVCRIDHSLDNLLADPESGEIAAFLDWEFQFAGTPAYDLAFVERSLAGGSWSFTVDAPDRHERIRAGLVAGYREAGGDETADRFAANRDAYALLVDCHELFNFDAALDVFDVDEAEREAGADRLRATVHERCSRWQP